MFAKILNLLRRENYAVIVGGVAVALVTKDPDEAIKTASDISGKYFPENPPYLLSIMVGTKEYSPGCVIFKEGDDYATSWAKELTNLLKQGESLTWVDSREKEFPLLVVTKVRPPEASQE